MHRSVTVSVQRREQPEDEVWRRAGELVHDLTARGIPPVSTTPDLAVTYSFPREDDDQLRRLLAELERARDEWGLAWQDRRVRHIDPDDFRTADLLLVEGVDLDDGYGRFLLNPTEAIGPAERCGDCGTGRTWSRPIAAPPKVDENRLRRPAELPVPGTTEPQRVSPREQWDLVALTNSAVVASARLIEALDRCGARGWTTRPVVSANGREASGVAMLEATTVGGAPCPAHSELAAGAPCGGCGRVKGDGKGSPMTVRQSGFADVDVTSAGPLRHGPLVLRRELVDRLNEAGIAGLVPIQPRSFCDD